MTEVALLVIAKAPVAGRVKTRLCPPCTLGEAAVLADAALRDTLDAVLATPASRRVLALDGRPPSWLPEGIEVLAQRGHGLAERLGYAFADVGRPAFLVGMDTPQLTPALLATGQAAVAAGRAALGPALDGGYWGIGLATPAAAAFAGVPMSSPTTGVAQRSALSALGFEVAELPFLRDVDTMADARCVAADARGSRFAAAVAGLGLEAADPGGRRRGGRRPMTGDPSTRVAHRA